MIKINDNFEIEKFQIDKGYIKYYVENICYSSECFLCIYDSDYNLIHESKAFDYDQNCYFFIIDNNLEKGEYTFNIVLRDDFPKMILESRRFLIK